MDLVRAPLVLGSAMAGIFVVLALLAIVRSNSRWDDHLINAAGVFAAGLLISLTVRLVAGAFRPQPGTPKRARLVKFAWLVALALLGFVVFKVAMFINNMSFL